MLRFQHPEYFWFISLLLLVVLLFVIYLFKNKQKINQLGDVALVKKQLHYLNTSKRKLKFILLAIALFTGIIGLANLQGKATTETLQRKGIDVMIALDVSKSMLAKDISPNRLEKAKQFIDRLMDKISNNRIGLIIFAGRAYVSVPLTIDIASLKMNLNSISPESVPTQGTVLGEAIKMARESFNTKDLKYKSIVLISDGEDHDESALTEVKKSVEEGVTINTVGIGSVNGSPIWDDETQAYKKDIDGKEIVSKLNEEELQQIATAGEGIYTQLNNAENTALTISNQINSSEKKSYGNSVFANYSSYFQYFIGISLLLILVELLISERKKTSLA